MNTKILLLVILILIVASGCGNSLNTQDETINCQTLCLNNSMVFESGKVIGFRNDYFSCTCTVIYDRE